MTAPPFSLPDQYGVFHALADYRGTWVVLYFYPKDDTPGCTKEACSFRDQSAEFKKLGVELIGISKDTIESHAKFAKKYHLNFPILADPEHLVIEKYGAWRMKHMMGRSYMGTWRNTYLISPDGNIVKTYEKVNPLTHAPEILKDIGDLKR